jgi:hypothetical protein
LDGGWVSLVSYAGSQRVLVEARCFCGSVVYYDNGGVSFLVWSFLFFSLFLVQGVAFDLESSPGLVGFLGEFRIVSRLRLLGGKTL